MKISAVHNRSFANRGKKARFAHPANSRMADCRQIFLANRGSSVNKIQVHKPSIMSIAKIKSAAIAITTASLTYAQPVKAEEFTGRDFLQRSESQKSGFISTSIAMAAMIAGQKNRTFTDCIGQWYFDDPRGIEARNREIFELMGKLPDYHPHATLLAVMERACGKFY